MSECQWGAAASAASYSLIETAGFRVVAKSGNQHPKLTLFSVEYCLPLPEIEWSFFSMHLDSVRSFTDMVQGESVDYRRLGRDTACTSGSSFSHFLPSTARRSSASTGPLEPEL